MNNWISLVLVLGICGIIGFIANVKSASDVLPIWVVGGNMTLINETVFLNTTVFNYNGTATEDLNMNFFNISNIQNITAQLLCLPTGCQNNFNIGAEVDPQYNANPLNYVNDTSLFAFNSTLTAYDSCLQSFTELDPDYNANPLNYVNDTSLFAFNSTLTTYDACMFNTYNSTYNALVSDNTTWSQTTADGLYMDINAPTGNSSWNETHANTLFYLASNPFNFINSTYNASYMTSTYNSTYDAKPSNTFNTTYNTFVVNNVSSKTDYMANVTERNLFTDTYNTTYNAKVSFANNTAFNSTILNATKVVSSIFCLTETCNKNMTYNGTYVIING